MKSLKTLKIGDDVFKGEETKRNAFVMKNLSELATLDAGMNALRNASDVTLMTIPKLDDLSLQFAFLNVKELKMENAGMLERNGELMKWKMQIAEERRREEEELRERRENGIVLNADDLESLPAHVKSITVNACEDYKKEVLDLSRFSELETLKIGSTCFNYVSRVSVVGLAKLRSMTVGEGAFQNNSSDCALVVKNCPLLCEVRVGNESFKAFKEVELVELASLKTITLGCGCFREVDLVLKDLKSLEVVELGDLCFEKSRHTVIESLSLTRRID